MFKQGEPEELEGDRADHALLQPVIGIRVALRPHMEALPDATSLPFVSKRLLPHLYDAAAIVAEDPTEGAELVLIDAYRTRATHQHFFNRERAKLMELRGVSEEEAHRWLCEMVGDPEKVFPHGTGGAVGVTLAVAGQLLEMGSQYGCLNERASPDYFEAKSSATAADETVARRRELLRNAMEDASFVGHEELWWHYELGTARWASGRDRDAQLNRVLAPPVIEGRAARPPIVPSRYPFLRSGVGQPFLDVKEGSAARLAGGHYYARISHPGGDELAGFLGRNVFGSEGVVLTASGVAAVRLAIDAMISEEQANEASSSCMPSENQSPVTPAVLYAHDIYHDSKLAMIAVANSLGWEAKRCKEGELLTRIKDPAVKIVYLDSPSNWRLCCYDLPALATAVHEAGAKLVVDVTLQPCQRALEAGVDLVVCSLSKDASLGYTMAGAVAGSDASVLRRVASKMQANGELITPETAFNVHQHVFSLRDRLISQALKIDLLASMLECHPAVSEVFKAESAIYDGLRGSQLAFRLHNHDQGPILERVIGQRSLDPAACLHLAGTFGAVFTTAESYLSRLLASDDESAKHAGRSDYYASLNLPVDLVRLGLGYERGEDIAAELSFALYASQHIEVPKSHRIKELDQMA